MIKASNNFILLHSMNNSISNRHIIISEDGSPTLYSEAFGESYHSTDGAIQESNHLFIENGLIKATNLSEKKVFHILEYGFGTGLNALLTLNKLIDTNELKETVIYYTSLEKYPLTHEEYSALEYPTKELFTILHQTKWHKITDESEFCNFDKITEQFYLRKIEGDFIDYHPEREGEWIDIIYFDPFSPQTQPQSWSKELFTRIYKATNPNGILVTYSAKGIVKEALRESLFNVKRIKGAGKKRHSLVATKILTDRPQNPQPQL